MAGKPMIIVVVVVVIILIMIALVIVIVIVIAIVIVIVMVIVIVIVIVTVIVIPIILVIVIANIILALLADRGPGREANCKVAAGGLQAAAVQQGSPDSTPAAGSRPSNGNCQTWAAAEVC